MRLCNEIQIYLNKFGLVYSDTSLTGEEEGTTFSLADDGKYGRGPLMTSFNTEGNGSTLLPNGGGNSCFPLDLHGYLPAWKK